MTMDVHEKAVELCEKLANSFYDREPKTEKPVFFSKKEIDLIEKWLLDMIKESKCMLAEY